MIRFFPFFLVLILSLNSCLTKRIDTNLKEKKSSVEKVVINPEFSPKGKNMRLQIQEVNEISPGIVEISFNYSGGCKEHNFNLYTTGGLIKTMPPKINLYLIDQQQDDVCRELISTKKQFDISEVLPKNNQKIVLIFNNKFEYILGK